jgi:hypothetical protein
MELGIPVYTSAGIDGPIDLIAEMPNGNLIRVQCKTARPGKRDGAIVFNGNGVQMTSEPEHRAVYKLVSYKGKVDLLAVRDQANDRLFLLPPEKASGETLIAYTDASKPNQRKAGLMAHEVAFERVIAELLASNQ